MPAGFTTFENFKDIDITLFKTVTAFLLKFRSAHFSMILAGRSYYTNIVCAILSQEASGESISATALPDVIPMIRDSQIEFQKEPACLILSGEYAIVGDLHGDLKTLLRIFERYGYPLLSFPRRLCRPRKLLVRCGVPALLAEAALSRESLLDSRKPRVSRLNRRARLSKRMP